MSLASNVVAIPGLMPTYFNVVKMPECTVVVYRRAFRVSASRVLAGDFQQVVDELRGMKFIEEGEYTVRRVAAWHDYFDVVRVGEEAPLYRLFIASSKDEDY